MGNPNQCPQSIDAWHATNSPMDSDTEPARETIETVTVTDISDAAPPRDFIVPRFPISQFMRDLPG